MDINTTNPTIKRPGRPIVTTSVRQQKLAEAATRTEPLRKGRPVNPNSARQQSANQKQTIIDAGGVIKPGRPKFKTTEKVDTAPPKDNPIQVS